MTEPIYIRQVETESIAGERIVLYYFTCEKKTSDGGESVRRYGVGIDMYTQMPDERTVKERRIAEGVFESKRDAEKFIDILCRGVVTPATLDDIISDNAASAVC